MSTATLHIYVRVLAGLEDSGSFDRQIQSGIQKSKFLNMGYKIWHEDEVLSLDDALSNRPVLRNFLKDMQSGEIKHVFVWSTDQLSRNDALWEVLKYQYLVALGVELYLPTGLAVFNDPTTKAIVGLLGSISQYDNELRTVRLTEGKERSVKNGDWKGGPPPYGYDLKDSKLVINDYEAHWVKFIYEQYKDGASIKAIRDQLFLNGVRTRRGKLAWSHRSIDLVLSNTHFDGYWTTKLKSGEIVKVSCPRLLESKLIEKVKDKRKARSYGKTGSKRKTINTKHVYLAKDVLICGHCGSRYGGKTVASGVGYYRCLFKGEAFRGSDASLNGQCPGQKRIRTDRIDEVAWRTVVDVVTRSSLFKASMKDLPSDTSVILDNDTCLQLKAQIKALNEESINIDFTIAALSTAMFVSERHKKRSSSTVTHLKHHKHQTEAEIDFIKEKLKHADAQRRWQLWCREFQGKVALLKAGSLSMNEKRQFIETWVDHITVTTTDSGDNDLSFTFTLPYPVNQLNAGDLTEEFEENALIIDERLKSVSVNLPSRT